MRSVGLCMLAAALACGGLALAATPSAAEGEGSAEAAPAPPPGILLSRPVGPPPVWLFRQLPNASGAGPYFGSAGPPPPMPPLEPQQGGCRYVPNKLDAIV